MTAGLPLWALSVFRPLPGWQRSIPVFWMLHLVGLWLFALLSEEDWLYPRFAVDGGFIADILLSIAFVMMGMALTSERGKSL